MHQAMMSQLAAFRCCFRFLCSSGIFAGTLKSSKPRVIRKSTQNKNKPHPHPDPWPGLAPAPNHARGGAFYLGEERYRGSRGMGSSGGSIREDSLKRLGGNFRFHLWCAFIWRRRAHSTMACGFWFPRFFAWPLLFLCCSLLCLVYHGSTASVFYLGS